MERGLVFGAMLCLIVTSTVLNYHKKNWTKPRSSARNPRGVWVTKKTRLDDGTSKFLNCFAVRFVWLEGKFHSLDWYVMIRLKVGWLSLWLTGRLVDCSVVTHLKARGLSLWLTWKQVDCFAVIRWKASGLFCCDSLESKLTVSLWFAGRLLDYSVVTHLNACGLFRCDSFDGK